MENTNTKPEELKRIETSKDIPSIYTSLKERFNVNWEDGIIICYGNTIHCKYDIPPEKIIHELVHVDQQEKIGKDTWWLMYMNNPSFRLEQEVEAYRKENAFILENIRDREARFHFLYEMARVLSSPQYGKVCTFSEAMKLIQG